jgi:hypothetical protein
LGILDQYSGLFGDSSDDIFTLIKWDFIFENGMVVEDDVGDDGFLSLHNDFLRGNIKILYSELKFDLTQI